MWDSGTWVGEAGVRTRNPSVGPKRGVMLDARCLGGVTWVRARDASRRLVNVKHTTAWDAWCALAQG